MPKQDFGLDCRPPLSTVFGRLFHVVDDDEQLYAAYDDLLKELWMTKYWHRGPIGFCRILWPAGRQARSDNPRLFKSTGLYLWGVKNRPLYIGITTGTFGRRFSRYIWQKRSQCNLAQQFGGPLRARGIGGFPPEVRHWYAGYGPTKVRLEGAVRFAKEGIDQVWFALVPHDDVAQIKYLERHLVSVAQKWNREHRIEPLLNLQLNHPANS